eukprot:6553471-Pyramimonas_sp.AAC.1
MRPPRPGQYFAAPGGSTERHNRSVRMRLLHAGQRFVAPQGVPPKAPVGVFACVSPTQDSA